MRAPAQPIHAPPFPPKLPWINVAMLRMDQQLGRPVLIEFWDFCRPNSIRTLPYMRAWHQRYQEPGLRVIGVHASGFEPSADADAVREAVARLEVPYPVVVDVEYEIWEQYGNLGWPARYLFDQEGLLFDYHYGEGGYERPSRRSRSCSDYPSNRHCHRCGPRTCPARCSRRRARTSKVPTADRTTRAACGRSSTAAAR